LANACAAADFLLFLTMQQPTVWSVSNARPFDPIDHQQGFDPGSVPPTAPGFQGELRCVVVDATGSPVGTNALVGEATLTTLATGDVAKYTAIGLQALPTLDGDATLCLGGGVSAACPNGAEYEGCPTSWSVDHFADGAPDPIAGTGSAVHTHLTIVPCTEHLDTSLPTTTTVVFRVTNEFEEVFSASLTVQCWADMNLGNSAAFLFLTLGTPFAQVSMTPSTGNPGFAVMMQEFHNPGTGGLIGSAAANAYTSTTTVPGGDLMVLPAF